jgi:hypothetical protein
MCVQCIVLPCFMVTHTTKGDVLSCSTVLLLSLFTSRGSSHTEAYTKGFFVKIGLPYSLRTVFGALQLIQDKSS